MLGGSENATRKYSRPVEHAFKRHETLGEISKGRTSLEKEISRNVLPIQSSANSGLPTFFRGRGKVCKRIALRNPHPFHHVCVLSVSRVLAPAWG